MSADHACDRDGDLDRSVCVQCGDAFIACSRCEVYSCACVAATTTLPRMAKPSMEVNISFRVSRALREAAQKKAAERQENVSDVLREALERYVRSKR